ncbi:ATP-binding cassette domain-containing protein [bacterium]|nr:MAG: ATP-binding cassette domain-containing protein [bacterium]
MALTVDSVSKRFGPIVALSGVSAEFLSGEIHAVLGENGAGKSTLMEVMAGFVTPDTGTISLDGQAVLPGRAFDARKRGIGMIHQHFTLVPALTVRENLALAQLPGLARIIRPEELARTSLAAAERLGWSINPEIPVRQLSVGERQRLEILKALGGEAKVLIFDEPTAVLIPEEVERLFHTLRQLRDEGRVVVLIAHKLSEVTAIADRVTVLRRGSKVAESAMRETDAAQLARWMTGEDFHPIPASSPSPGTKVVGLRNVVIKGDRGEEAVRGIDLEIRRGEILAIGGVDGNGQHELAEALAGVRPIASGLIAKGKSVGYVPGDRQGDGLAAGMSIRDNLLVTGHRKSSLAPWGWLSKSSVSVWARELIAKYDVRAEGASTKVAGLSGGNQQKVVIARALADQPALLVAVNPTRGLDLKATAFVHAQIVAARDAGAAIALISTDRDELAALGDRTIYVSRGLLSERLI